MLKRLCQCIGIASLILVINYGDLLGGGADVRMHTPFSLAPICYAQIADIVLLALFLFAMLTALSHTGLYRWVRLVLAIVIPPYLIQRTQSFFPFDRIEGFVLILLVVWAALLLLLLLRFPKWYRGLMKVSSALAASLVIFALCSIAQLLWVASWKPAPNQITANWETGSQPPRQHPLLVWIIFDELSYDQVFEHRARDLNLTNFDALRSQSTLFTDTQPVGYFTVKIVPSLLTGKPVDGIRYNFHNHLWVHHDSGWAPINGADTVFGDAKTAGWRTAAVGWYNPYCAIYADAIQNCYWTNHDMFDGLMAPNTPFLTNIYTPLQQVVRELKSPSRADRDLCTFDVRHRYQTHIDLQQHAFQLLRTDQADFVFLHFSLPHSPNIWSRINDNFTQYCDSSYLDNLALSDHLLGQLMETLKASPRWNQTTLILQGDHGWRIDAWSGLPSWTDEDDAAARDTFDTRPALIIHQPGQNQPQTVTAPWPIVQVHSVIEQVIHGQPLTF